MLLPTIASVTALAEAMTFAPGGRHPVQQRPLWQAKMKADHGGANLLDPARRRSRRKACGYWQAVFQPGASF